MNRADRRRQAAEDEKLLHVGIKPEQLDNPNPTAAMARQLAALFELAKKDQTIDRPIRFLQSKIEATLNSLKDTPVACKMGCSHCCHIWVSATAPEVLFVAKSLRRRPDAAAVVERVKAAHLQTKDFQFDLRNQHPHACPLLVDNLCSAYEIRPLACRLAASRDAEVCARSFHNLTKEDIPTPPIHLFARGAYGTALAVALKYSQLRYEAYEFNGALARALDRNDAEPAWLAGEDVFAGLVRSPSDPFASAPANMIYRYAFR